MAEPKKSRKPQDPNLAEGKAPVGREKEEEVGGRGKFEAVTCWRCGAINWVDPEWPWFCCWRCSEGCTSYIK